MHVIRKKLERKKNEKKRIEEKKRKKRIMKLSVKNVFGKRKKCPDNLAVIHIY